jgi:hypothetical protein
VGLFRLLVLAVLIPIIDLALPLVPEVAQIRAGLLQPGDPPRVVERVLGLREYSWTCSGNAGDQWFSAYHDPKTRHSVTIHYRQKPGACDLRLQEIEVKR